MKKIIEENFKYLSGMSVKEYTLYRKWMEINEKYPPKKKENPFFDLSSVDDYPELSEIKSKIWIPKKPDDYLKLEPEVVLVNDKETNNIWNILRIFTSRMTWKQNVGRIMRFFIRDKATGCYLGVISVASDFISLGGRDSYIGWSYDDRIKKKMLAYTAMGSSIVPTQPLGFSYVGGKLLSLLVCSDKVENSWNAKYKEPLVGFTTTSLYGGFSQYNRLKYWKKCKSTKGEIPLEPSDDIYRKTREYVKDNYPKDFEKLTINKKKILSRPKARLLAFAYTKLGIKPPVNS
jgi:hypothetical protein